MRGIYRDPAEREAHRDYWLQNIVPDLMRNETDPLKPLLAGRLPMTVVDVGASKGFWSKAFLTSFPGQVERILMIDPSPENVLELSRRDDSSLLFDPEDFGLLSVEGCALGAHAGVVTLFTNEDGSPLASLFPHVVEGHNPMATLPDLNGEIAVTLRTLDDVLAEYPEFEAIDVLKMDVEGAELEVLKGAHRTLAAGKVDIVTFEFGVHQVEARHFFRDFYQMLGDFGYRFNIINDGQLTPIDRYDYAYENFTTCWTFVAARETNRHAAALAQANLNQLQRDMRVIESDLAEKQAEIARMKAQILQTKAF